MRAWVKICDDPNQHPNCGRRRGPLYVPTRLIDLDQQPSGRLRVVHTTTEGVREPYVTLSHCWGVSPAFAKLTKRNFTEYTEEGIPPEDIQQNQNFSEAIEVARNIGIRYIWIDSLCIIQEDKQDWDEQAPLMHQVYRNSYCNVAASDSAGGGVGPGNGLFRDRTEAYTGSRTRVDIRGRRWCVVPADMWQKDLLGQALYARGWVFQERMLSPRMLHFTAQQIFWDCATVSACEAFPSGIPQQLDSAAAGERRWRDQLQKTTLQQSRSAGGSLVTAGEQDSGDSLYSVARFWEMAVSRYTSCKLTNHSDKLKAMWGVAKLVRDAEKEDYGAGLWADSLPEQLGWKVAEPKGARREPGFPSWSWASIRDGTIQIAEKYPDDDRFYEVRGHDGESIFFQLKDSLYSLGDTPALTSHVTSPAFDMEPVLKSTSISMRCLWGPATSSEDPLPIKSHGSLKVYPDEASSGGPKPCHFIILAASESMEALFEDGERVYGAEEGRMLYSGHGLLVEPIGGDRVRRMGAFVFEGLDLPSWLQICQIGGQPGGSDTKRNAELGRAIWLE